MNSFESYMTGTRQPDRNEFHVPSQQEIRLDDGVFDGVGWHVSTAAEKEMGLL